MNTMTIEQKVASAILNKPVSEIEINGVMYPISRPAISTLILVSEIISTLPIIAPVQKEEIINSVLHNAKDFKALGDIAAVLILGRKNLTEEREVEEIAERKICGFIRLKKRVKRKVVIDKKAELAETILDEITPSVLNKIIIKRLTDMEIGDFFAITTSLSEANILKPTKEVD